MSAERISVTVPSDIAAALRALAKSRRETISIVVSEAIAHQLRTAALEKALAEADQHFGPVPDAMIAEAEAELAEAFGKRNRGQPRAS